MTFHAHKQNWKLALIDLDGTLYRGSTVITGASEFVRRLRDRHVQPVFFTNNATRTPEQVVKKLTGMGIEAYAREVCTSSQASAAHIADTCGRDSRVLFLGQLGLQQALVDAGLRPMATPMSGMADLPVTESAVLGLSQDTTYWQLANFCESVVRLGKWVLTNKDVRLPAEGRFMPGNGAIGQFVETATGIEPYVAGKPNEQFVRYALHRYEAEASETVIIGDNVQTDIAAGAGLGIHAILVESGVKYVQGVSQTWEHVPANERPDEVFGSVSELFLD